MQLNNKGYVSHAYIDYIYDDENEEVRIEYNSDDQIVRTHYTYDGEESEERFTYANGDITKWEEFIDGSCEDVLMFHYTNSTYSQPIANKGGVMLWGLCFPTDLDGLWIASYAGLLGKATKNLPMSEQEGDETTEFLWKFNTNQLPTAFTWEYETDEWFIFNWK